MKIAIVGAGAMGSLFGGCLAASGADVTLVDVDRAHVDAIQAHSLALDLGDGPKRIKVAATTEPRSVGPVDLIVVFCKHLDTAGAVRGAAPMMTPDTYVWTLQNGVGNAEIIAETVSRNRIAKGLTSMTGIIDGPGRVSTNFKGTSETFIWPVDSHKHARLDDVVRIFTKAGLPTFLAPDIDYRIWRKLVVNASLTVVSAAANVGIGPVGESEAGQKLLRRIVGEVVTVARAQGVPLQLDDAIGYMEELRRKAFNHVGSTTIDLQNGRPTEIDAMCGAVARHGQRLGVPTPANEFMAQFVKLLEATRGRRLAAPLG